MHTLPARRHLGVALALALCAGHAHAEDDQDKSRTLDAVVVKGTVLGASRSEDVQHYAGSRQVIARETLDTGANRSLDDALQRVPGVKIFDETGTGALPQIALRGLYESRSGRVQALLDGIPLSLAPYGQTSLSLFPVTLNQIDRIDIVRGGAAVQYGPNNVGGVINLVSKPIPERWTSILGERITAYGRGQMLKDTSFSTGGYLSPNFGLQVDADWQKGEYFREHSGTNVKNVRLRSEWWLGDDKVIKADVQRYVAHMELAGALSVPDYLRDPRQATRPLDRFKGTTTRASFTYEQDLGNWWIFDSSQFTWTNFSADSERNFIVGMRRSSAETWRDDLLPQLLQSAPRGFKVYGTQPQFNLHIDSGGVTQQWTVGARAVREDIDFVVGNTGLDNGVYTLVRDWGFKDRAWAAYISNAIGFMDDRFTVTPGVRYEHLDATYRNRANGVSFENNVRNWLPGLTLGFKASDKWYVYADAQRSLRAPQVTQIVFGDNLDSELAWNYELGARFTPTSRTMIHADVYRIDFDKQIQLDNTTRTYGNIGKTIHQGLEADIEWSPEALDGLKLNLGYAYLDAAQKSGQFDGKRVPYTSRNQVTLGASYTAGPTVYALSGYYFSKSYSDTANTKAENAIASIGQLPSYAVWNAQVTHTFATWGTSSLKGSLALNNMFDKKYWFRGIDTSPWGRQPAPSRSVTLGAELTF
ncbi:MAG: Fe(3+) dicitrate transport protein FecA [Luteibacter sp.]|uniref:TonB-dependent receptor family protein n=1 Tax=Luteibacter sp. TaxID=1886636 RepID=UPI00137E7AFA|nr:TonB-dependent siderophore receptor [Luteibacter sp.]KAF1006510.1 MAG: Fe(3+) dicitrate transport protein FecA [Luteibacter sp.]